EAREHGRRRAGHGPPRRVRARLELGSRRPAPPRGHEHAPRVALDRPRRRRRRRHLPRARRRRRRAPLHRAPRGRVGVRGLGSAAHAAPAWTPVDLGWTWIALVRAVVSRPTSILNDPPRWIDAGGVAPPPSIAANTRRPRALPASIHHDASFRIPVRRDTR